MTAKKIGLLVMILVCLFVLTGCLPGDMKYDEKPANFLSGIWHGWVAPVSLIFGFFNKTTRVYEAMNTGWWYDFGFYIAILGGFGGFSLARKKNDKKK